MKCKKCNKDNILKAKYCKNCGNKFTPNEKTSAYHKTIYYKIELLKKWYDHLSLVTITSHIAFKIISLIIVLGFGIYNLLTMGINTKILNSNDYKLYYNKTTNEYYVIVKDKEEVNINIYKPNRLKELNIVHYDNSNNIIEEYIYNDSLILKTYNNDYYIFKSKYGENNIEQLKVTVYKENDINFN